eukprot:498130-Pyramimonas_sp.AAC.1
MHRLRRGQEGRVLGEWARSQAFPINAGVPQGCALSPVLFTAFLEWAMCAWRARTLHLGFHLGD